MLVPSIIICSTYHCTVCTEHRCYLTPDLPLIPLGDLRLIAAIIMTSFTGVLTRSQLGLTLPAAQLSTTADCQTTIILARSSKKEDSLATRGSLVACSPIRSLMFLSSRDCAPAATSIATCGNYSTHAHKTMTRAGFRGDTPTLINVGAQALIKMAEPDATEPMDTGEEGEDRADTAEVRRSQWN